MLRRRSDETPAPEAADDKPGKGRPTPKRREAEARRRRPIVAQPKDRKGAREQARLDRVEMRAALERGDESRLPARDRGPVRRYARDYVDSRRTVAEFFLPLGIVLYIPLFVVGSHGGAAGAFSAALMILLVLLVFELIRLGIGLSRALRQAFPDKDRHGAILYGLTRAGQIRRWRLPRPQVKPGQHPVPKG